MSAALDKREALCLTIWLLSLLMYQKLKSLLFEAGLNEAESRIYIALLKQPVRTKWDLVSLTGLDRNKVYRACKSLSDLNIINYTESGIEALSLNNLIENLENTQLEAQRLATRIKEFSPFLNLPLDSVKDFEVLDTKEKILEKYILMSEIEYGTCLDFGDLEAFVPVLGGLDPVFKFRQNRYNQNAKNEAVCTSLGPYTSCMMRENDMKNYKSNIDLLNLNFDGTWIIFSDTNDYVLFNHFIDRENPSSVLIKSKIVANAQRLHFESFRKNLEKF